ncbi:MAG: DUF6624 domain-containing protein [Verrucomicrobiota bacterium]
MNEALRQSLLDLAAEDQRVRAELATSGELFHGYNPRMAEVHDRNARALEVILKAFGWPGKSLVGADGSHAAWLILQHAIGRPELLRQCLPLLERAAVLDEIEPAQPAYLEDRICFFERRPQRYGTQFDWDETGQMSPWPIANPEQVDSLRAAIGLPPLAEQIQSVREAIARSGEAPPEDWNRRQAEMLDWARAVGWKRD